MPRMKTKYTVEKMIEGTWSATGDEPFATKDVAVKCVRAKEPGRYRVVAIAGVFTVEPVNKTRITEEPMG